MDDQLKAMLNLQLLTAERNLANATPKNVIKLKDEYLRIKGRLEAAEDGQILGNGKSTWFPHGLGVYAYHFDPNKTDHNDLDDVMALLAHKVTEASGMLKLTLLSQWRDKAVAYNMLRGFECLDLKWKGMA